MTKLLPTLKDFSKPPGKIEISERQLTLRDVLSFSQEGLVDFNLTQEQQTRVTKSYQSVLQHIKNGEHIYGVSAAYGAQANRLIKEDSFKERVAASEKLTKSILHVDVSVGDPLSKEVTRAAMLIRLNTLLKGVSGVSRENIEIFTEFINSGFTPLVGQYGSLGASGDLAQNGRILSALLLNPHVRGWTADGKVISLGSFLKRSPLRKLDLHPKAGLSFVNGDNFSTAAATLLSIEVAYLFFLTLLISSLMVQVLKGTNQSFHPYLSTVRPFYGQAEVATILKDLLVGSSLSYDELEKTVRRPEGVKIQDKYSLRCLPQYLGPALETILSCLQRCEIGINSVSDNPILIPSEDLDESKPWQWLSGGNFLGNYAAESIDGLRKVLTQIVKLCDRHLAMLVSQKDNNGLPANLSSSESLAGCVFKGYQNQMGMFEVYASVLSIPVTTFFGVHEEGNQDVTAHGLTSWILAKQLLSITKYALATNLIASIQAVDLLGGVQSLSPKTRFLYEFIRNQVPFISVEQPMSEYLETVNSSLNYSFYLRFVKEVTS